MAVTINESRYSRILGSDGSTCSVTNGKLDVNATVTMDIKSLATESTLANINGKLPMLGQAAASGSLSIVQCSDKPFNIRSLTSADTVTVIATDLDMRLLTNTDVVTNEMTKIPITSGTLWNNEKVISGNSSLLCDIQYCSKVSIFGSADKATTLSVEVSSDKINWYNIGISYKIISLSSQFHMFFETGCRYVRLTSSGDSTITAFCSAKM